MAKAATKKKPAKQPDLFDSARNSKSSARKAPKASARAKTSARGKPAGRGSSAEAGYTAKHIEVLEGLEPVRRRPGMYIGGTDEKALHHLFAEVIDNAMDEALAGHADWIEVEMEANGFVSVTDNGRGIPVDPHPKFKSKSALEVIMCTLHAGGKFDSKVYETSGGLHGVGVSVANALSERMEVEVAREQQLYRMAFERGKPKGKLEKAGRAPNRRGTKVRFRPDPQIFGPKAAFKADRVFKMTRSKAYLFGGVEIRWHCDKALLKGVEDVPEKATFHFEQGLKDYLSDQLKDATLVNPEIFSGTHGKVGAHGAVQWAVAWTADTDGFLNSYCNTIPTPDGGTHESGLRSALLRGLKDHAARIGQEKRASSRNQRRHYDRRRLHAVGVRARAGIPGPDQGPSCHRRGSTDRRAGDQGPLRSLARRQPAAGEQAARFRRRARRGTPPPTRRKRTSRARPRFANCACPASLQTAPRPPRKVRRFSSSKATAPVAPQNRRAIAAPRRCCRCAGKILNVASAGKDKLAQNAQLADLIQALGCGTGTHYHEKDLRYEKVIIMTDADVDGAHIASLLITFFYRQMQKLIEGGRLYLAVPPLFRLQHGGKIVYARDDKHKDALLKKEFHANAKVEVSRFKGLGEMMAAQLKETTMDPGKRTLLRVVLADKEMKPTAKSVERLMGTKAEARFEFIQEKAEFASAELLDV